MMDFILHAGGTTRNYDTTRNCFDVFARGLHVILTTGSTQHSYGVRIDAAELRHFIMTEVSISSETQA